MKGGYTDDKTLLAEGGGDLPAPSMARTNTSAPARRFHPFSLVILILVSVPYLGLLLVRPLFDPSLARQPTHTDDDALSYWHSVLLKGFHLSDSDATSPPHAGCHPKHRISPKAAEKIYLAVPSNDSCAASSKRYTAHAHPGGSGWDLVTAQMVKADWERALNLQPHWPDENVFEAGSDESQRRVRDIRSHKKPYVWIDTYYPTMNTPVSSSVTLLTDPPVHAKLREAKLEGDEGSQLADEVLPFHGLSVSGDVTAKFVYAGYGRKDDFDLLQQKGVSFDGKIALVKYGGNFRGLKVKAAQEAGAVACIVFTDPGDDGEITEANGYKQYPQGPARVPSSIQRGSTQWISVFPGDPTTPGKPAYANATREEPANINTIPSLPMSYEDVIPILNALRGKGLSAADLDPSFGGGLTHHGVEYWTGPSDVDLHLVSEVNTRVMPIWNTMAVIPGHIHDEVVVMGNHRDAWVLGAADPNSGTASQLDMIRGLGTLWAKGWRPMRTIILASWDAEEYGLIGSTEWAEDFGDWLSENAVAYLNFDSSASGSNFRGSASPSLALLLRSAAEQITKIDGRSVWDARADGGVWDAASIHAEEVDLGMSAQSEQKGSGIRPLGSGSDYTAFLQRYGVASTDFSFGGGPKDPVYHYHSVYDSHTWMSKFGDPGFKKHAEGAQIIGLVLLRLADALILPLNTTQYTRDLGWYLEKVASLGADVDLEPLGKAIHRLDGASRALDDHRAELLKKLDKALPKLGWWDGVSRLLGLERGKGREIRKILKQIRAVNIKLRDFEKGFISEDGIKDRTWYKHKGTAPGKWLGYGATTFPGLTEAIAIDNDNELAQKEADQLTNMLNGMAEALSK